MVVVLIEASRALLDERSVDNGAWCGVFLLQQQLADSLEECEVTVEADLQESISELCAGAHESARVLRVLESLKAGLGQRVHGDHASAVLLRSLQGREHPWVIGPWILARDHDQVLALERHAALADADRLGQRSATGLVAHV